MNMNDPGELAIYVFINELRIDIRLLYCSEIAVPDIVVVVASALPNWGRHEWGNSVGIMGRVALNPRVEK